MAAAEETKAEPPPPRAAPGAEQEVVAFAGGLRGRRAAQLGCGAGVDCVCLAAAGCRLVVGVDADGAALAEARRRAARAEVADRCLFVEADPLAVAADELLERAAAFERARGRGAAAAWRFDAAVDRRGLERLWARDADGAARLLAGLLRPGAEVFSLSGNANEYRPYADGAASLTCAELCSCLPPPCFELRSLRECRFDGPAALAPPPLAWRAVFRRTPAAWAAPDPGDGDDDGASGTPTAASARASTSGGGSLRKLRRDEPPRLLQKRRERPVVARKVSRVPLPLDARPADYDSDAIDAALSVDGSVAPSECGSDATSAFAGADGFENIAASRAAAARAERARAEGDVPWVRWWDRRAQAYDRLVASQPILQELCDRVARAALRWAPAPANPRQPLVAVDLAAGAGHTAWALARHCRRPVRAELVEPSHAMAALARARGARPGRGVATVWQVPVERCAERPPARLRGAADCVTCRGALSQINEHDVLEAAAALLKPGGCLVLDLEHGEPGRAWEDHVRDALRAAGVAAPADVARVPSLPPARPACSASQLAAAAAAAGLRLASCDAFDDAVGGDFFVASRSVSSSWLAEAFAGDGDRAAARVARRECILDAARRAAASAGELRTALVVVLKPDALADDDSPENGVSGLAPRPGDHF